MRDFTARAFGAPVPTERCPEVLLDIQVDIGRRLGHWRFVFLRPDGSRLFAAEDIEPGMWGERLELLTLIRALEALDRPAVVFLLRASPYLEEGIRFGLPEWRVNNWQWEHFDRWVPIRNIDLWHRLDWALQFHQLVLLQASGRGQLPTSRGLPLPSQPRPASPREPMGAPAPNLGRGVQAKMPSNQHSHRPRATVSLGT